MIITKELLYDCLKKAVAKYDFGFIEGRDELPLESCTIDILCDGTYGFAGTQCLPFAYTVAIRPDWNYYCVEVFYDGELMEQHKEEF